MAIIIKEPLDLERGHEEERKQLKCPWIVTGVITITFTCIIAVTLTIGGGCTHMRIAPGCGVEVCLDEIQVDCFDSETIIGRQDINEFTNKNCPPHKNCRMDHNDFGLFFTHDQCKIICNTYQKSI